MLKIETRSYPIQQFNITVTSEIPAIDYELISYMDYNAQRLIHTIKMFLATDTVETATRTVSNSVEVPATWWDMFKQDVLSKYFKVKVNTKKMWYTEKHTEKTTTVFRDLNVGESRSRGYRSVEVHSYGGNVY